MEGIKAFLKDVFYSYMNCFKYLAVGVRIYHEGKDFPVGLSRADLKKVCAINKILRTSIPLLTICISITLLGKLLISVLKYDCATFASHPLSPDLSCAVQLFPH